MRPEEAAYWDEMCALSNPNGEMKENVWKRGKILSRIFSETWVGETVLEIGVGNALAAAALRGLYGKLFHYAGTDVSSEYCRLAKERFNLDVFHTDILALPRGRKFTRVLALDSLEHVDPKDREDGWKELGKVLADSCRMFVNIPLSESQHNEQFDHAFGLEDLIQIEKACSLRLESYEVYPVKIPSGEREYAWAVMSR